MTDHICCDWPGCTRDTRSSFLRYCREHDEQIQREILFGKEAGKVP